jgi:hypothetical protein
MTRDLNVGEAAQARYAGVNGAPGTAKSTVLAKSCRLKGPRRSIAVVYNRGACASVQQKGAHNAHTMHSLGLRSARKSVLASIRSRRQAGDFTALEAPASLNLTLVQGTVELGKSAMLLHHLHPPTLADGDAARVSLTFRVYSKFVPQLLTEATQRGYGLVGRPALSDVPALMALSRDPVLMLDVKLLEPAFARLSQADMARFSAQHTTSEARLLFGCALLYDVHVADLHTTTNPTWSPRQGVTLLHLQLPGGSERARLPAISYDGCITTCLYLVWVRAVHFSYDDVYGDEKQVCSHSHTQQNAASFVSPSHPQDFSYAKFALLFKIVSDSDAIRGNGHITRVIIFGDDDQSVNGWVGAEPNTNVTFTTLIEAREATLVSL